MNFYGPIFLLPVEDKIDFKTQKSVQNRQNRNFSSPDPCLFGRFFHPILSSIINFIISSIFPDKNHLSYLGSRNSKTSYFYLYMNKFGTD